MFAANTVMNATDCNKEGLTRFTSGDEAGALAAFEEAIGLEENCAEAWNNAGIILQRFGRLEEAAEHFDRAVSLLPDYVDALNNRGRLRQQSGDLAGAAADFDAALSHAQGTMVATVYHNRGMLMHATGDFAGAIAEFDRALDIAPESVASLRARSLARKAAGDLEGALSDVNRALALTPPADAGPVLHERGGVKVLLRDWAGAVADYDETLRLQPDFWLAMVSRGHARYHRRDFGGVKDYLRAFQINAEGAIREIARFTREDAARDPMDVLRNCGKHLRINHRDAIAHARRCLTLAYLQRNDEAEEELECFRQLAPDLAGYLARILKVDRSVDRFPSRFPVPVLSSPFSSLCPISPLIDTVCQD